MNENMKTVVSQLQTKKKSQNLNETQENKGFYSAKELYELNVKELPMLVEPIFLKSGISVFAGSSDTGKSTFLRNLAISVVRGDDQFLGWEIKADHRRAIYVSTEDDRFAISYLLNKTLGEDIDTGFLENFRYIFDTERLYENLDAMLEAKPADCVIIDALTDLYGGELNQSNKVREFLNPYFILADKYQCLFIFLHHTGKGTEKYPPNKNNLLGSQGIEGKARQVIELRRDPSDNSYRHLCIVKGNYIPDDMKEKSFKLKFNENMTYDMTEETVDFENLVMRTGINDEEKREIMKKVFSLKGSGKSFVEVAEEMTSQGHKMGKSKAHQLYQQAKEGYGDDLGDPLFDEN